MSIESRATVIVPISELPATQPQAVIEAAAAEEEALRIITRNQNEVAKAFQGLMPGMLGVTYVLPRLSMDQPLEFGTVSGLILPQGARQRDGRYKVSRSLPMEILTEHGVSRHNVRPQVMDGWLPPEAKRLPPPSDAFVPGDEWYRTLHIPSRRALAREALRQARQAQFEEHNPGLSHREHVLATAAIAAVEDYPSRLMQVQGAIGTEACIAVMLHEARSAGVVEGVPWIGLEEGAYNMLSSLYPDAAQPDRFDIALAERFNEALRPAPSHMQLVATASAPAQPALVR